MEICGLFVVIYVQKDLMMMDSFNANCRKLPMNFHEYIQSHL